MTQILLKPGSRDSLLFSQMETLHVLRGEENILTATKTGEQGVQAVEEQVMELRVNNYLKTPDEIEMEFRYGINPGTLHLRMESLRSLALITNTDGYSNIHDLDKALSGFMEENY